MSDDRMSASAVFESRGALLEPDSETDDVARRVIGAAIEVHRHLGPGYLEFVYQRAMEIELELRGLGTERQVPLELHYKGMIVGRGRIDLVVERRLVVELKSVSALAPIHLAQALSYLRATDLTLALLINFNTTRVRDGIQRVVRSGARPR
jgi:GxxExxY protein